MKEIIISREQILQFRSEHYKCAQKMEKKRDHNMIHIVKKKGHKKNPKN